MAVLAFTFGEIADILGFLEEDSPFEEVASSGAERGVGRMRRTQRPGLRLTVVIGVLAGSCGPAPPALDHSHYRISAVLEPAAQSLRATATISLRAASAGVTSAQFLLHRQLTIAALDGPAVEGYRVDTLTTPSIPWIPDAARVTVALDRPLDEGQVTEIRVEYGGVLDTWPSWSANVVGKDWTELGLYLPWFPYFGAPYEPFTYEVDVEVPPGFVVRGTGDAEWGDGRWSLRSGEPARDIVLVAARDVHTIRVAAGGFRVRVHHADLDEQEARRLGDELLRVLETFAGWFGPPESSDFTLIESRRERGGGYARKGLVVVGSLDDLVAPEAYPDLLRYLAHEVAHFWWHEAPSDTWEDWLNESFAEYSALLLLGERLGEAEYRVRIEAKREAARGTPPIWGLDRSDTSTEERSRRVIGVLYSAGPVALDALAARISRETFLEWCRRMAARDVASTGPALELLEEVAGAEAASWFEGLLRAPAVGR
jgi:aminopeptidase N